MTNNKYIPWGRVCLPEGSWLFLSNVKMGWRLLISDNDGICPFQQAHIHIPDRSTSADPALEPSSLSQGKSCLAPCYFWLCLCLWDPLTFSNENKTTEGAALWLAESSGMRKDWGLKPQISSVGLEWARHLGPVISRAGTCGERGGHHLVSDKSYFVLIN